MIRRDFLRGVTAAAACLLAPVTAFVDYAKGLGISDHGIKDYSDVVLLTDSDFRTLGSFNDWDELTEWYVKQIALSFGVDSNYLR